MAYEKIVDSRAMSKFKFRKEIQKGLINNPFLTAAELDDKRRRRSTYNAESPVSSKKSRQEITCKIASTPLYSTWDKISKSWKDTLRTRFPQRHCKICRKEVITYCVCDHSTALCKACYPKHISELYLQHIPVVLLYQ